MRDPSIGTLVVRLSEAAACYLRETRPEGAGQLLTLAFRDQAATSQSGAEPPSGPAWPPELRSAPRAGYVGASSKPEGIFSAKPRSSAGQPTSWSSERRTGAARNPGCTRNSHANATGVADRGARLVRRNPFAFLVAVALDRGLPWRKAWQIPTEIDRKGCLDPERLASMSEAGLIELLDSLPIRHRWGATQTARTLSDAARLVCEQFDGDAGAIWRNSSPAEVEKTLQEIHGLGAGIAAMATRILHDESDFFKRQQRQIDVKPDRLLLRVFRRAGPIDDESAQQARRVARRLSPRFPGALDWPAWRIG